MQSYRGAGKGFADDMILGQPAAGWASTAAGQRKRSRRQVSTIEPIKISSGAGSDSSSASVSPPVQSPGPPKACHPVSGAPLRPALCVVVKATSTPNSRLHGLSLVPARCAGPYVVPTRLVWVGRVAIAVRPNIFLRVVGRGAAVLGCCCQPLRHFSPSLPGSCSTNRSHGAAGGVSIMAHHYARPRISSL